MSGSYGVPNEDFLQSSTKRSKKAPPDGLQPLYQRKWPESNVLIGKWICVPAQVLLFYEIPYWWLQLWFSPSNANHQVHPQSLDMLVTVIAQFAIQKLIEGFRYLINIEDELAKKRMKLASSIKVPININTKNIKNSENQLLFGKVIISQSKSNANI